MGPLFVIVIHLVIIFIISIILAVILVIIALFSKLKRKRKIIFAVFSPFLFCYTLYFFALFSSEIISSIKNVDSGIGDHWYVPLNDDVTLNFIDLPENCYLQFKDGKQISDVQKIVQLEEDYYLKIQDINYVLKNDSKNIEKIDLKSEPKYLMSWDFYIEKKNKIAGTLLIICGIISLLLSSFLTFILRRTIVR